MKSTYILCITDYNPNLQSVVLKNSKGNHIFTINAILLNNEYFLINRWAIDKSFTESTQASDQIVYNPQNTKFFHKFRRDQQLEPILSIEDTSLSNFYDHIIWKNSQVSTELNKHKRNDTWKGGFIILKNK